MDAVTNEHLELIADAAAGDARVAISSLRVAARHASQNGLNIITDEIIQEAIPEAESEIRQKNTQQLTTHQQTLLDIITEHGEIAPKQLYETYRERVEDAKTDRMVRYHLQKMERYNLIVADGENRGRTYRAIM